MEVFSETDAAGYGKTDRAHDENRKETSEAYRSTAGSSSGFGIEGAAP
jgi:hypothetical protein